MLALLTYDVVGDVPDLSHGRDEVLRPESADSWAKVQTSAGIVGYVFARYVRSPIDMRLAVGKVDGRWLLTMVTGGD